MTPEMQQEFDRKTREFESSRSIQICRERRAVVDEARLWLGTPFHHGQCVRGAGVDCAQLLIGVYCHGTGLLKAPRIERYSRDWFLHEKKDRLMDIISDACIETTTPEPGDIAVFRFGRSISHSAIVIDAPHIIHAERMIGFVIDDRCDVHDSLAVRLAGYWTLRRWSSSNV